MNTIREDFNEARDILEQFISHEDNLRDIEQAGNLMAEAIEQGNKVISCGNGGSMSDAMHFAEELTGRFRDDRRALPAIAISDPTHLSCTSNDYGYDHVFSRYLEALGQAGDVLLGISTSGNSVNIVKAVEVAREKDMRVVALTGKDGGKLSGMADVDIRAPKSRYSDRAQEIHIKVIHALIHFIEQKVANEK
ncbi:MAG: D-sedoheptulose 7-phosphate isomerase [Bacteroidota bacterium]